MIFILINVKLVSFGYLIFPSHQFYKKNTQNETFLKDFMIQKAKKGLKAV